MGRGRRTGATAAAVLPAALAGAALVSAPFAGTTTAPLATSTPRAHSANTAGNAPDSGIPVRVPTSSVITLVAAELALTGVGATVIVVARRRRHELADA